MATREGEVRVQVPVTTELARQMDHLAVELRPYVDDRDRAMQRGPMIAYVARWFYSLPRGVQGTILNQGRNLADRDKEEGVPDFRAANEAYLASLQRPEWLVGVAAAIEAASVDPGSFAGGRGKDVPLVPIEGKVAKSQPKRKRANSSN